MATIKFKNTTDQDFSHQYNGSARCVKAGETVWMDEFEAQLFAKHLTDREMNRMGIITSNKIDRDRISAGFILATSSNSIEQNEAEDLEDEEEDEEVPTPKAKTAKKPAKKAVKKPVAVEEEEDEDDEDTEKEAKVDGETEFEDLEDEE